MTLLKQTSSTPRRDQVKAAIRNRARHVGPGGKLPTVLELCELLGVAKATVNSALDGLEAEGILRRRRGSGIFVTPRVTQKTVALVFGGNVFAPGISPFYALLVEHCRVRAASHKQNFSFFIDLASPQATGGVPVHQDLADAIATGKLHGILLASQRDPLEERWLRSQPLPVVGLTPVWTPQPYTVGVDYDELIRLGIDALAEQGCRRLGFITPFGYHRHPGAEFLDFDLRTFAAELRRHGLRRKSAWVWDHRAPNKDDGITREEQGNRAITDLFADGRKEYPDGLLIADDMMTRGALVALRQRGLAVGREVKIATHANTGSAVLHGYDTELTLIEVNLNEVVEAMFGMLERLMDGQDAGDVTVVIKPRRGGCAAAACKSSLICS